MWNLTENVIGLLYSGFYFIPGALSIEEQSYWIRESLQTFPQPPNRTNHTATYGPIYELFSAVENQKVLIQVEGLSTDVKLGLSSSENSPQSSRYLFSEARMVASKGEACKSVAASVLLRKLRWSTLGLQFDWSKVDYQIQHSFIFLSIGRLVLNVTQLVEL